MRGWDASLVLAPWTLDTFECGRTLLDDQTGNQSMSDKDLITIVSCVVGFLLVLLLALAGLYMWWECKKQVSVDEDLTLSLHCPRVASASTERISPNSLPRHTPVYKAGGNIHPSLTSPTSHVADSGARPAGNPVRCLHFMGTEGLHPSLPPLRTHPLLDSTGSDPVSPTDAHVQSLTPLPRRACRASTKPQGAGYTQTDQPQVVLELEAEGGYNNGFREGLVDVATCSSEPARGLPGPNSLLPTDSVDGPLQPGSATNSKGGQGSPLVCRSSQSQDGVQYHHMCRQRSNVTPFRVYGSPTALHGPTSLGPSHALASTSTSRGSPTTVGSAGLVRSSSVQSLPCKRSHQDQMCDLLPLARPQPSYRLTGGPSSPVLQRKSIQSSPLGRRHRPDGVIEMPLQTPHSSSSALDLNVGTHELRFRSTREVVRYQASCSMQLSTDGQSEVCAMGSPRKTSSARSTQEAMHSMGGILDDICRHTSSLGGGSTSGPAVSRRGTSAGAQSGGVASRHEPSSVRGTQSSAGTGIDFCLPLPPLAVVSPQMADKR